MKLSRMNWMSVLTVLAGFVLAAWYGPSLPDPVPTHFNAFGEVDGWTPKPWGVWMLPLIEAGLLGVLLILPAISPRGFRLEQSRRAFDIVVFVVVIFMLLVQWFSYRAAISGEAGDITRWVPVGIGFLFLILGNYLGKFQKNFFVGIRTPWTLASDEVWNRTHRLAGFLFMIGGVLMVLIGLLELDLRLLMGVAIAAALVPVLYSFILYRRLEGFGDEA